LLRIIDTVAGMLIISSGTSRAVIRLASGHLFTSNQSQAWGKRGLSTIDSAHDRIPADLAELLPSLEELGLTSGDNGKSNYLADDTNLLDHVGRAQADHQST
jgi:hypothetical protein